jgi:rhodanese-related sulfurtransferase
MGATRINSQAGFLSHTAAIAAIQDSKFGAFLPKVNTRELANLLDNDTVAIVDARLPVDYQAGHLKGAISVPVTSNPQQCEKAISHVPKERRIIVYSHSNGCNYGERVAKELLAQGYHNISLFRGGWVEWEKHYPPPHRVTQLATEL